MEIAVLIIALLLFVGLIVLLFRWVIRVNKKKVIMFQEWAQQLGLQHTQSKYMMNRLNDLQGQIDGLDVHVYEKIVGSGKHQTVVCNFSISPSPFNFDFRIGKEHFFSKTGKLLGMKDVEIGDEKFDKIFLLKSKDESQLKSVINYKIQGELMQVKDDLKSSIYANPEAVTYATIQPVTKQAHLASFEQVLRFAINLIKEHSR